MLAAASLHAQEAAPAAVVRPDTARARPPVSPRRAFVYSALLPGLGQSALQRPTAGAFFFVIEAVSLAMVGKSRADLREAERLAGDSAPPIGRFQPDSLGRVARNPTTGTPLYDSTTNRYRGEPSIVAARRTHLEDWIAVLLFNHLISGADAFVAAQLWDLPIEVRLRALPRRTLLQIRLRR